MPTLLCAAAIEAVVAFLATVYMVRKKSLHSFFTALAGTLLNILLNAILIPRMGALGAAVATLIGYGSVYLLRTWDVPRLIRFRLCLPRQIGSVLLLLSMAAVMTWATHARVLWTALLAVCVLAINLPTLLKGIAALLRRRRAA